MDDWHHYNHSILFRYFFPKRIILHISKWLQYLKQASEITTNKPSRPAGLLNMYKKCSDNKRIGIQIWIAWKILFLSQLDCLKLFKWIQYHFDSFSYGLIKEWFIFESEILAASPAVFLWFSVTSNHKRVARVIWHNR